MNRPPVKETPISGTEGSPAKRTGATREHYQRQKSQCYAYFRVRREDADRTGTGLFTIYDFITNSFSFSTTKKTLAVGVLEAVKERPSTFNELVTKLDAKKSTLYLVCLSLERSGLLSREGKAAPYSISADFARALRSYADWYDSWAQTAVATDASGPDAGEKS